MIIPIVAYGSPVLKRKAEDITPEFPNLKKFIEDMFETMYEAHGVGLAAPQVGQSIRVFVIDCTPFAEDDEEGEDNSHLDGLKKVFINAKILEESGEEWSFREGCLSIPEIREEVRRKERIRIEYFDEDFNRHEEVYDGYAARVIQHEYDHIEGILFTDRINPLKRNLLKGRLSDISKGNIDVNYRMKFPVLKKLRR